jgi:2-isopropylmalate synthase
LRIALYDATLTEGVRQAGVQLSTRDKLRIAIRLAEMGVAYVEAGWAGADDAVLSEARRLSLHDARLCACATLSGARPERDRALAAALASGAPAVTIAVPGRGRPRDRRALAQVGPAVAAVRRAGRAALVDLADAFDALRDGARAPLAAAEAAARAGAEGILLSDTSGGALPREVEAGVLAVRRAAGRAAVGVRARDDAGVAVANTLAAVWRGATLAAATVNGYGERCGAADLVAVAAALELKMGHAALAPGQLKRVASLAHFVAELADRDPPRDQPYVGRDAFARSADGGAPPHVDPEAVGNRSEQAMADERGHPGALRVARELGLPAGGEGAARRVLSRLAAWERRGFRFEGAEASFELLLRTVAGRRREFFRVLSYRVLDVRRTQRDFTEATVEVAIGRERRHTAAFGVGPVNALDRALRAALEEPYPEVADMQLVQSRSRNLAGRTGTAGPVRVTIDSADGRDRWGTAGVSDNLIDACCQALVDALEYKLVKDDVQPRAARGRR